MVMMTTAAATAATTTATATEMLRTMMKPSLRRKLSSKRFSVKASSVSASASASASLEVEFDPKIPIEKALTPPSSWYSLPSFYSFELDRIFYRGWQVVGNPLPLLSLPPLSLYMYTYTHMYIYIFIYHSWWVLSWWFSGCTEEIKDPGDYFTGRSNFFLIEKRKLLFQFLLDNLIDKLVWALW